MKSHLLYFVNLFTKLLPETSFFGLKRWLFRFCGVKIGKNVRICSSAKILGVGVCEIGDDVWIGPETLIVSTSKILIGNCVDIAPRVLITTGTHELDASGGHSAGKGMALPVIIEDGAWICACSCILPGCTIGKKSVVAAGAVITQSVPSRTLVAGVPAIVKKTF